MANLFKGSSIQYQIRQGHWYYSDHNGFDFVRVLTSIIEEFVLIIVFGAYWSVTTL